MPFLCVVVEVPPVRWLHSSWVGFDCSPDFCSGEFWPVAPNLHDESICFYAAAPFQRCAPQRAGAGRASWRRRARPLRRVTLTTARPKRTGGNATQQPLVKVTSSRLIPILPHGSYPLKKQMRHLSKSNAMIRAFKFTQASQIRCFFSGVQIRGRDDAGWVLFGMQLSVPRSNLLGLRTKARCKCDARILGSAPPDPCQTPLMEWVGVPCF